MARVRVLGPVDLVGPDDTPVALAPRTRRLLAALVVRAGEVATVDWLAEVVWGDAAPENPDNAVQTLVSRLRSAVRSAGGGPEVLTRPDGYVLVAGADDLDLAAFRGLRSRARAARTPEERVRVLDEALELWRGPAYGGFVDEAFCEAAAAGLTEQRATACGDLAAAEIESDQLDRAHERLAALVVERPYDERPSVLLMQCLEAAGRVGDALAVFADLARRLRDDLGVEPSASAREQQRALLRPRPEGRLVGLPPPAEVIGRGDDERALSALLGSARLVTVIGPGGLGKTTLAIRVARRSADAYADGVVAVELGRLEPDDEVAAAVCTVLQVPLGHSGARQRLFDRLRDRHLLLVLDNCEHLVAGLAPLVERLLAECPGVSVLATSRVGLRLPAEHLLRLEPLSPAAAVELFGRRARIRDRTLDLDDAGVVAAVTDLCRRLDGLPLAIELAAGRADVIGPAELVDRWSWHRSVLRGGPSADPRHRSLTALVDWSYDRLTTGAQRVLEAVSVFAGPFSVGDAADLLGLLGEEDPGWSLAALVDASLLGRSAVTGRLRMLETIREYGRFRLAARDDADAVHRAHATMVADRAVAGRAELYGPGHAREVRRQLDAVDELRAAFGWAIDQDPALASRIAGSVALLVEHALLGEAAAWADTVLRRSELPRDPWLCAVASAGAYLAGDLDRAGALADEALALAAAVDPLCEAFALVVRGDVALSGGDLDAVLACRDRAAEPTRPMLELTALLARHYAGQQVDPAEALAVRLDLERQGRSALAAWAGYAEGELLLDVDPGRALVLLADALERARHGRDEYLAGVALVSAASAAYRSDRLEEARRLFTEAVRHWQIRGDRTHQWTTLRNVVLLLAAAGQSTDALTLATSLLVPERGAGGFGADAEQLTRAAERLTAQLGESAAGLLRHARALRDDQVIEAALRALER